MISSPSSLAAVHWRGEGQDTTTSTLAPERPSAPFPDPERDDPATASNGNATATNATTTAIPPTRPQTLVTTVKVGVYRSIVNRCFGNAPRLLDLVTQWGVRTLTDESVPHPTAVLRLTPPV